MIQRANDSSALITVIINGDILLFEDFYTTLNKVVSTFRDFLIVGARYDVDGLPNVQETDPDYTSQVRDIVQWLGLVFGVRMKDRDHRPSIGLSLLVG
mmetsp:Transcript_43420/g.169894  ORF Transcript_43420/g.169894 Transcript_43420/m.169894 type:complete len:98 (+) Transcript_43420:567-860(+)